MYLNEKSWETKDISLYAIRNALVEFVRLYAALAGKYGLLAGVRKKVLKQNLIMASVRQVW